MKPLTERKHEPQAKYGAERNTRSALNYFPPHGALAPFCALALPAAGLCVGLGRRAPAPRFPCRPPAPPCAPFSPLRLVASLLRRAGSVLFDCGGGSSGLWGGSPASRARFRSPCSASGGKIFPALARAPRAVGAFAACALPLASLGLCASACPPALAGCPPCRRALLYALAVRRKGYTSGLSPARCAFPLRAFRALMAAAAGVCGECFLISLDNTETIGSK